MQMEMERIPWQKCLDKIDYKTKINKRKKKKKQHNTLHNNQVITPTRRQNNYKYI